MGKNKTIFVRKKGSENIIVLLLLLVRWREENTYFLRVNDSILKVYELNMNWSWAFGVVCVEV